MFLKEWPASLGCDLAGEVVEVGPTKDGQPSPFKVGQRVLSHALFLQFQDYTQSAFQNYTIVLAAGTAALPDNIDFADASVLPLSLDTVVAGLYTPEHLNLPLPKTSPVKLNKTILCWGGSGSVGASAVQLAVASGFTVISTSSPGNFEFVKSLGAANVLDYNDPKAVSQIIDLLQGTDFVGAYDGTGSPESAKMVSEIVSKLGGGKVASALETAEAPGVVSKMVFAPNAILEPNEAVGKAIWGEFLTEALRSGQLKPAPPAKIVGHGLAAIIDAIEECKKGVSAVKLVVTL